MRTKALKPAAPAIYYLGELAFFSHTEALKTLTISQPIYPRF